ncbi:MAG: ATP-binding cassette domain-containing protein [Bacteroidetes bacterium]|nr:ATP-binding cassette domain-containing protein [Bacteroidota bacterium]
MTEPVLMALVQLFATVAATARKQASENSRLILESYLRDQLNTQELEEYLKLFDELLSFHQPMEEAPDAPAADLSHKISAICHKISRDLPYLDRLIIFIKFIEFIDEISRNETGKGLKESGQMIGYTALLKSAFNIPGNEYNNALNFVLDPFGGIILPHDLLLIDGQHTSSKEKHIFREHMDGCIMVLFFPSIRRFFARYLGKDPLYLNGHNIQPYRSFFLANGSILNNLKIAPVYYSDIASKFLHGDETIQIEFTASEIEYRFKNSNNGIHPFSFTARSGELIGIMGGSGVGKSTLLNVFNGSLCLNNGDILINGYKLGTGNEKLEGVIGFVPQDDLLVEELTVFENLYFNAKLCFRDFSKKQLMKAVLKVLKDIGLIGIKDLRVGDPMNKFISGGQRKRLNIALELIREPSVLFVDEPTSGLSSMDSELVMLLLKEQTLKGRLVVVNIHQPSSDIYKLFDILLVMDKGGYPIYYGNPIDALTYFKTLSNHANPTESECQNCGYVNPELILQITEAKTVSEYGKLTVNRKVSPEEWYGHFRKTIQPKLKLSTQKQQLPSNFFKVPGRWKQFSIFAIRNLLTKVTNRQYLVINLFEAPFLAALLAFLTRYYSGDKYFFGGNKNLVAYMFMSVVVALFLGMMVSAEEIFRDRRILKREAFLHLSRSSYLNSKIILLFVLSAIQTLLYVLIGDWILGIKGMTLAYWLILFSASCFANMAGLNISSGLDSIVAIYIIIPFILVPQLLLSGTIVPFDNLNPTISSRIYVPFVGDMMASRWSFEAMAVEQFRDNRYEKQFYAADKESSKYSYITALRIPALQELLDESRMNIITRKDQKKTLQNLLIIGNEITGLEKEAGLRPGPVVENLTPAGLTDQLSTKIRSYLDSLSVIFSYRLSKANTRHDAIYQKLVNEKGQDAAYALKQEYYNESLADLVLNAASTDKIIQGKDRLIRKKDPVFMDPESVTGRAHFYAPAKFIGPLAIDTFWFNIGALWLMSLLLYLTLQHNTLRKTIEYFGQLRKTRKT